MEIGPEKRVKNNRGKLVSYNTTCGNSNNNNERY